MGTGQYLDALAEVRPGQKAYLPALMAASQVDLTDNPDTAVGIELGYLHWLGRWR